MTTALDVARYILEQVDSMSAMKLQKLVYYSQAWSLVWDEKALFSDRIEAWANGPVVPALYKQHRGQFVVSAKDFPGDSSQLTPDEKATVDGVLKFYGDKTAQWLSDLTHAEKPWIDARKGLDPGERSDSEITAEAMGAYYSSI